MGAVKDEYYDEIQQRALFKDDSDLSQSEAFQILAGEGIDEIKWSPSLNDEYMNWIYLNLK